MKTLSRIAGTPPAVDNSAEEARRGFEASGLVVEKRLKVSGAKLNLNLTRRPPA